MIEKAKQDESQIRDEIIDVNGEVIHGIDVFDLLEAQGVDVSRIRQVEQERT